MSATPFTPAATISWQEYNQGALVRAFARLRLRLGEQSPLEAQSPFDEEESAGDTAIDRIVLVFGLTPFERDLLLLTAGVEMDSELAGCCAALAGHAATNSAHSPVTFSLALATLGSPHWSALSATAPLRRFRLITLGPGRGLTNSPLEIDERILHYLAGTNRLDRRLEDLLFLKAAPEWMDEDHFRMATEKIEEEDGATDAGTVLHLCGNDALGQESVASLLAHRAGRLLYVLRHEDTPAAGAELEQFLHLWARERLLLPACLLLQWGNDPPTAAARQLAERLPGQVMIASREPFPLHRAIEIYPVDKPGAAAQERLWQDALGLATAAETPAILGKIAQQFSLSAETIVRLAGAVEGPEAEQGETAFAARLWSACRVHARPRLEGFAERIAPTAAWEDLILPEAQKLVLRQIAAQSRNRMKVYESWGFAARGRRGLGLSALFAGPSGTGKTLAAEVLAAELDLDLYRIDLSAVVSKYIGETEKNLRQVFDAAETGGCILLFDEADALFGKRAEVKDSHDRYANIEVGYLLQRMESFQGLAILTTNLKSSLDKSFQRRLRFTVDFPFPDAAQRQQIWARVFPAQTPTHELDAGRLATLNMTGGNIRNIALNAAFLAAEAGESVSMAHLLEAARLEAIKTERPIAEMEIRGWV